MTPPDPSNGRLGPQKAECLHCGASFTPRKFGHVFCTSACRHRGERRPDERDQADPEAVARLFDASRDPDELVSADDWHPSGPEWYELDGNDTVAQRRRWYGNLWLEGML